MFALRIMNIVQAVHYGNELNVYWLKLAKKCHSLLAYDAMSGPPVLRMNCRFRNKQLCACVQMCHWACL